MGGRTVYLRDNVPAAKEKRARGRMNMHAGCTGTIVLAVVRYVQLRLLVGLSGLCDLFRYSLSSWV